MADRCWRAEDRGRERADDPKPVYPAEPGKDKVEMWKNPMEPCYS